MIELLLSVCLWSDPRECKEVRLTEEYDGPVSVMTPIGCLAQSQWRAAQWVEENPGWKVEKVTCSATSAREARAKA